MDHRWPGSAHDMRVYFRSNITEVVEGQNQYCMVGDSAYSISETLVKPFSEAEINNKEDAATKRRKTLFNKKTMWSPNSHVREHLWPYEEEVANIENMRHHIPMALKSIQCCCIFENVYRDWNEEDPEDNDDIEDAPDAGDVAGDAGAAGVGAAMQFITGRQHFI